MPASSSTPVSDLADGIEPAPLPCVLLQRHAWPVVSLGVLLLTLLTACSPSGAPAQAPGGTPPPPAVGVVTVAPASVTLVADLPGRLEPVRVAQVRARVSGIVKKRLFTEGALVAAGQSLFEIDAAPYRATLDSALASQAKAEAGLTQANAQLERNRPLAEAKAISQQDWVATQAAQLQSQAEVAAARAAVQQARLSVDYAAVQAPISGRIGRAGVTEGALVSATEATLLATVQQVDNLYVNFTQSASEALRLKRAVEAGRMQKAGHAEVHVLLEDGSEYPLAGKLLFSELTVDSSSGQVTLRAELPNPKGDLLPGLYVKVRVDQGRIDNAILLPQQAVTRGVSGDTVLVVGDDGMPSPRTVQISSARGNQWVVLSGLKSGERVIVDGFQKMRPKSPVTPVPWTPLSATAAGAGPTAVAPAASAASR